MALTERVALLVDLDMRTDIDAAAGALHLTVNQWVRQAIREKLARDAKGTP